jgi:hypothetical protein
LATIFTRRAFGSVVVGLIAAMVHTVPVAAMGSPGPREAEIVRAPLSVIDPDRRQSALTWRSPFCLQWEDGRDRCRRTSVTREPTCVTNQSNPETALPVVCSTPDGVTMSRVCRRSIGIRMTPDGHSVFTEFFRTLKIEGPSANRHPFDYVNIYLVGLTPYVEFDYKRNFPLMLQRRIDNGINDADSFLLLDLSRSENFICLESHQ